MSIQADRILAVRTVKTVYLDGDTVIKVFDKKYPASAILGEARCQSLAAANNINAPRVKKVDTLDGRWAIYSEYIPGDTLWQVMQSSEDITPYLDMFVDLQMQLHEKEVLDLPCLHEFANHKLNLLEQQLYKTEKPPVDSVKLYQLQMILENMPEEKKVCHCDFAPWNIILKDGTEPYLLDWPSACHGNKDADVAQTFLTLNVYGESALANRYIKLYAQKSGTYLRGILRWVPILAACRLASRRIDCKRSEYEILEYYANASVSNLRV